MKSLSMTAVAVLLILTAAHNPVTAGPGYNEYDSEHFTATARVLSSVPIYRTVRISEPREECYEKAIYNHDDGYQSATPMIAGGILGGIAGNQFGSGNGKTFMTLAGTVLGGSLGRDYAHRYRTQSSRGPKTGMHCEIVDDYREEEQLEGYRVTYRYHGQKFVTTMPYDPGKRLKLDVRIRPYE